MRTTIILITFILVAAIPHILACEEDAAPITATCDLLSADPDGFDTLTQLCSDYCGNYSFPNLNGWSCSDDFYVECTCEDEATGEIDTFIENLTCFNSFWIIGSQVCQPACDEEGYYFVQAVCEDYDITGVQCIRCLGCEPFGGPTDPTTYPTDSPTDPTDSPIASPTDSPTDTPTDSPTEFPTHTPTGAPTESPTDAPTNTPTGAPDHRPHRPPLHHPHPPRPPHNK